MFAIKDKPKNGAVYISLVHSLPLSSTGDGSAEACSVFLASDRYPPHNA